MTSVNSCGDCKCCFYGAWTTLPLVLSTLSLVFSWSYTFSCHFWTTTADGYPYDLGLWDFEYFTATDVQVFQLTGWTREHMSYEHDCVYLAEHPYWDVSDTDGPFQFARSMALLVCLLGFLLVDFIFCLACYECDVVVIRYFMVQQVIFGIMTFLVLVRAFLVGILRTIHGLCFMLTSLHFVILPSLVFESVPLLFRVVLFCGSRSSVCFNGVCMVWQRRQPCDSQTPTCGDK